MIFNNFISNFSLTIMLYPQVLAACVAMSSAQTLVTHPNGAVVPADTLEVAAARAAHLGLVGYNVHPYAYAAYAPNGLVAHYNGAVVPADTPEVYAAKVAHAAAGGAVHPVGVYGVLAPGLVAHPNGAVVPLEPADVVNARAEHLAAHASA